MKLKTWEDGTEHLILDIPLGGKLWLRIDKNNSTVSVFRDSELAKSELITVLDKGGAAQLADRLSSWAYRGTFKKKRGG